MAALVGCTGLEPVTSALSKQRSEPTELTTPVKNFRKRFTGRNIGKVAFTFCGALVLF